MYTVIAHECIFIDEPLEVVYEESFEDWELADLVAQELAGMISDVYGRSFAEVIDNETDEVYSEFHGPYNADKALDKARIQQLIENYKKFKGAK